MGPSGRGSTRRYIFKIYLGLLIGYSVDRRGSSWWNIFLQSSVSAVRILTLWLSVYIGSKTLVVIFIRSWTSKCHTI